MTQELYIIDSSNLAYRCWWGVRELQYNGIHTGLEFGFIRKILSITKIISPDQIYLAWDGKPTRCLELLSNYKANRVKVNSDEPNWAPRLERLRKVFSNICNTLYHENEEADEQIAKFVNANKDKKCIIMSNDKDLQQLIGENTHVLCGDNLIDKNSCQESWQVPPHKIPLFKALDGDSADNIKGVPRLLTKTKIKLVNMSETIDELINNFNHESLTAKEKQKLEEHKQQVANNYKIVDLLNLFGEYNLSTPNGDKTELNFIINEMGFKNIKF